MGLVVIEGGLSLQSREVALDDTDAVIAEGKRRLRDIGYDGLANRERLTGLPVPKKIEHFRLQVDFVVSAISAMTPIPSDFRDDAYWPAFG